MNIVAHDRSPDKPEKQEGGTRLRVFFVGVDELFSRNRTRSSSRRC